MSPHNASSDLKTQKHKRRSTPKQTWWFVGLSWAALTCEGYCFQYSRSLPFCFYRSCRFSPSGAPHTVALHAAPEADQGRGVTNGDCCPKRSAAWHSSLRSGPCTTWHGIPGGERKGIYDILCIQGILRGFKGYIYICDRLGAWTKMVCIGKFSDPGHTNGSPIFNFSWVIQDYPESIGGQSNI